MVKRIIFAHEPESHACKGVPCTKMVQGVDEWLSVQGSAPPREQNPVRREATAVRRWSFTVCLIAVVSVGDVVAEDGTISHLLGDKTPVKAHVSSVTNESGQRQLSMGMFKKALEDSLNNRKAIDFDTVNSPFASDIKISVVIKKYQYLERGPFKPTPSLATTLVDAAATATSNYAEMEALFTVTDSENRVLWTDDVNEYIKKVMTPEESIPLIYDKVARKFIYQCFGHAHKKETVKLPM